ncbi:MAG: hypothetical protein KJP25_09240 [Gammaproteobacteria bacterium]|nr:hypothetical protein [Gammaproteobacteria bacterium]RZV54403.1 MAG: hypothetical protein EX270_07625 [Pseudomonadales bacterium]
MFLQPPRELVILIPVLSLRVIEYLIVQIAKPAYRSPPAIATHSAGGLIQQPSHTMHSAMATAHGTIHCANKAGFVASVEQF